MDAVARYQAAERLLVEALELHRLANKNNANDYMAVRRLKKRGEAIWSDVDAHLQLMQNGDSQAAADAEATPSQDESHAAPKAAPRNRKRRSAA